MIASFAQRITLPPFFSLKKVRNCQPYSVMEQERMNTSLKFNSHYKEK